MKKRILSILLTLCMTLCLTPISVFAEKVGAEGSAAIQLGTDALSKNVNTATAPTVYFGQNQENKPAAWRVIGYDGSGVTSAQGDITLLAEGNMGVIPFVDTILNNEYAPSNLKTAIDALAEKLTTEENAAAKKRALTSGSYNGENTDCVAGGQVDNAVFWPLSTAEAFAVNNDLRALEPAHPNWVTTTWWLRSPGSNKYHVAVVSSDGSVQYSGYSILIFNNHRTVRPAFNLNMNSVLFASAAVGGKPDGGLTAVPEYSGNEWKLTLLDSSRNFAVTEKAVSADPNDTITLNYSGATTGANEYISAIIADNNGAQYYGRVAQPTAESGTVEIKIPSDIAPGNYTLKVFSEQYNGDYKTDYASNFTDIALTVEKQVEEQFSLTPGGRYYFDLSAMNIPGTVNTGNSFGATSLPDTSLHYVPFTYAGTIEAYKLTSAMATTEEYAQKNKYPHSLFIADHTVTNNVSWDALNTADLIFGRDYAAGGVDYTLRAPSVGSGRRGSGNDIECGTPQSNEWDRILDKNDEYIKNWFEMYSWGQDTIEHGTELYRAGRGFYPARQWDCFFDIEERPFRGFRPVLELPTDLAADSLKIVELLTGEFMPGEQQNWINIIVKKGESFTAPSAEGLPRPDGISADAQLWWVDENSNFYKPGDTVPADVSALTALWGGFGLFLDRGDGEVEVTPDNYTDIFGDGTASFVLPKGKILSTLVESGNLTPKDILEIYSTGKLERYGSVFPNLKLKNADLTSVRLSEKYIGNGCPLFITADGKNTVGSLNEIWRSSNTLSILGDGSLTLNSALTLGRYTQYGGGSVTMTDGLAAYDLTVDSGSLTVTGDTQAITLRNQDLGYLEIGDGARLFTGSSAQDATEAVIPQLSAEMQELYQRYLAGDNTLTNEEFAALNNAFIERVNAISQQLPGKAYVRITGAWDVTYQPGTNGSGNAVTDIKFYNDALTLKGKLFTRTGYTQVGWATTDGGEKVYGFDDVYTKNEALTLYPVWNTNKYTITFDTNGGSEIAPITQDYGTQIAAPANPTRKGYTFKGWDKEIPETMPSENITVKAQWEINQYTIAFDTNGGSEIAPITQDYGTKITAPADPTRKGYTFKGWDKEIPETMPAENMTVKAQWEINQYAITFDTNGGSEIAPITQDYGTAITAPADPTRKGYTFKGWDKEIPETMPAENITVKAQWEINQYAITFDTNGGSEIAPITQDYGTAITAPDNPTREGYTFIGWDRDIPEIMPAENITVTAQWKINRYTITFDTAGGSDIAPITQDYGTEITAPDNPTREGYTFIGWDRDIPEIMPAENITVTAQWKDSEKPTGEIKISENSWKAFLNNITFGLFFKDTQTVTITAADNSGETVTVEYLLSDKELTKAEFDGMTFTAYTAPFGIDPDNEYIIYVRLTDNAGNTDYICSDGIVLDGTSPVITGIEDGKTYCEAQIVTVDEKYIDTVKVSGNTVTLDSNNQFTLNPAEGEQTIVVTDKAGNETRVIVTVNDGHTYKWQSENGQYWQKCKFCNHETAKKDIPTINISGADKVCRMQDYKFSFTLPEGATDAAYGYEFIGLGDGPLTPTFEGGMYCGVIKSAAYPAEETSFKLIVSAKTADGFEFSAEKTVAIQNEHSGGTATCTEQATCEICGEKYGDLKPHSYSVKWSTGEASHWHECTECRAKTDEAEHTDTNKDHKCDVCDKVLSECTDTNKDHKCDLCGKALSEHSGGKATCKDKAKCEFCGESYGELNANNHSDLKHFPAVAATKTAEGNIEYWYCEGCGKYYSDKDGTKEIKKADTVTAKLKDDFKSPQTGDTSNLALWIALLFVSGGAAIGTTVVSRKKKYNR